MAIRAKEQYVIGVMGRNISKASALLFLLGTFCLSLATSADDNAEKSGKTTSETEPSAEKKPRKQRPKKSGASERTPKDKPSGNTSTGAKDAPAFVDRDGDGIRDGKEHRFRRGNKKRKRNRHHVKPRRGRGQGNGQSQSSGNGNGS